MDSCCTYEAMSRSALSITELIRSKPTLELEEDVISGEAL